MATIQLARTIITLNDNDLAKFTASVEKRVQTTIFQLGKETRDMARRLAPKKTGALRASIYVTRPGTKNPESGPSYAKQSTIGYFRAINAAYRKQLAPSGRSIRGLDILKSEGVESWGLGPGEVNERTQTLSPEGKKAVGISEKKVRIGGITYNAQETSDDEGGVPYQSIMPYAGSSRNSFFVTIGAAVFYAGYVEFGVPSRGISPQPFLTPAIKWAQSVIVYRMGEAVAGRDW